LRVPKSNNFAFLASHDEQLVALGTAAERYFGPDPVVCLIKCRQLGEVLAQQAAAYVGLYEARDAKQLDLLDRLEQRRVLNRQVARVFHDIRRAGNIAVHQSLGDHRAALHVLKLSREAAIWFHQSFGSEPNFKAGAFVPPAEPEDPTTALQEEIAALQKQVTETRSAKEVAEAAAEEQVSLRLSVEERLEQEARDRAALEELLEESAQNELARVEAIQQEAVAAPSEQIEARVERAAKAADRVDLDEAATRRIIDDQLRDAGWEVDTGEITYAKGVRPQKNRNIAIAEWPTDNGPADYVLFVGLQVVAVVEAKKKARDVSASIEQSKRYSRGYVVKAEESLPGGPWGDYKVPFLFATNGRPYLRQLETKSGVWFLDARRPTNNSYALNGWYSPQGLKGLLRQDVDEAHARLDKEPTDYLGLRDYQLDAVKAAEQALKDGQRKVLLAMATGTGKTRTCIGLCYRLLKSKRFRRVLFLVDRTALGIQATNAFKDSRLEGRRAGVRHEAPGRHRPGNGQAHSLLRGWGDASGRPIRLHRGGRVPSRVSVGSRAQRSGAHVPERNRLHLQVP
jgi:type I restriction enzyme R subunit